MSVGSSSLNSNPRTTASDRAPSQPAAQVDPQTVMRIKNLQLRAKAIVEGFYTGLHRSPFHGFSVEFSEYRPYTEGDDLRGIDWKVFARTDRLYTKRFEDETNRRCYLVVDQSKSMGFGSLDYNKVDYAQSLAASLAYYLTLQRDSVGVLTFDEAVGEFLPARHRHGHLHQIMVCLSRELSGQGTDIAAPLQQMATLIKKRGLIVLISDMLAPVEMLGNNLSYLRSRGHEVVVMRVVDPAEADFDLPEPSMVVDMESGREVYLDPEQAKANYMRRYNEHADQLQRRCDTLGVDLYTIQTDQPLDTALFNVINAQQRRRSGPDRGGALAASVRGGGI